MNQQNILVQQSVVLFLLREGMWKSAQQVCGQQYKTTSDPFFQFWKAFSYFKDDSINEAINELSLIQSKREFGYATGSALIYYYQQQRNGDRDTLDQFKQMQSEGRKNANDKAIQSAVYFYLLVGEFRKAKESSELMVQSNSPMSLIVLGWQQILDTENRNIQQCLEFWNKIGQDLQGGQKPLEYLLGLAKISEWNKKFTITLDSINEIMVVYPTFPFSESEKSKVLTMIGEWEQSFETSQKVLYNDSQNIFALKTIAFYKLAREGNINEASEKLDELIQAIEKQEDRNINLMLQLAQIFSRVAGRNPRILTQTISLLQRARKINPLSSDLVLEMAVQTLMLEDYEKAYGYFQEAAALDEGRVESLAGMIQCRIHQGIIDDAEKQLEFVNEIQVSAGRSTEIAYLEALLESKKATNPEKAQKLIDEALKLHITNTKQISPGFEFYIKLNPDFLITLSQMYFIGLSTNSMLAGKEVAQSAIGKGTKLLETVAKQIPGLSNAYLLLATGKLALGDQFEALKAINIVLEQDNTNEDAYILHALISVKTGSYSSAINSLNQAISNNFMIRENPLFMLIKGDVEFRTEDYKNMLATMEATFEIPGVKELIKTRPQQQGRQQKVQINMVRKKPSKILTFGEQERSQIFVLYAKALAKNKKDKEAKQIMLKAIQEFAGTNEEGTVMLANSEIAIESGDVKKAINILKVVQPDQATFKQSRVILADIYLNNLKDNRNYTKCYMDLIEADDSYDTYRMMGDALMRIHEPEDACQAYVQAYKKKQDDEQIIRLIGSALSQTYDYTRAIQYYEQALSKNQKRNDLVVDLGALYLRIGDLDRASNILKQERFKVDDYSAPNVEMLKQNSQGFLLIARMVQRQQALLLIQAQQIENQKQGASMLQESNNMINTIRGLFEQSINSQKDALERVKMEGGNVQVERDSLAAILIEQSKFHMNVDKNLKASYDCLEEAIKIQPTSEKILQLQSEILYKFGDRVQCESKLKMLLKLNPKNDFANIMLSELMLLKDDSERVIETFKQMLKDKPDSYGTLAKVIDWYRRQNRLLEVEPLIKASTEYATNPKEPGLCYCRGLFYKWSLKPKEALTELNIAKRNQQYAEDSLTHMIDIYLNPELDLYYTLVEENARQIDPENLKACDMLLKELATRGTQLRYIIMQSYVLMLSQQKQSVELAIQLLSQLLKQSPDCVPAMLALAVSKFIAKKQTEAKNLLKILWKRQIQSNSWEAEELERAWLLYADSFIAIQKYDQAEEVLKKCLQFNKSCGKAEEYMGLIKEKEQSYVDAANHYETAFKLLNQRNLNMGYRLAFNYLKAKRYVEALNICKLILDIKPQFPKIKKEIQEKAILALR